MYGAILGDIIGSPFEFDRGNKSKKFELFSPGAEFTDDTVMIIAVCEGLLDAGLDREPEVQNRLLIKYLQKWGRKYPYAGYGAGSDYSLFGGGRFRRCDSHCGISWRRWCGC